MTKTLHLSGSAMRARWHALNLAGRALGEILYEEQRAKALKAPRAATPGMAAPGAAVPNGTSKRHWLHAYGVLALALDHLTEIQEWHYDHYPQEFEVEGAKSAQYLIDLDVLLDDVEYVRECHDHFNDGPNPLLDDQAWTRRAADSLIRNHWVAVTVLTATLHDHDPRPGVTRAILGIRKASHWRVKPRSKATLEKPSDGEPATASRLRLV